MDLNNDNPNEVEDIPQNYRILTYEEKLKIKKLDLGIQPLRFIRMCIPNLNEGMPCGWKIGCSGTNINITYIIHEDFQLEKFIEDVKKKKEKGQPVYLT